MRSFRKHASQQSLRFTRFNAHTGEQALAEHKITINETFRDPYTGRRMKMGEVGCASSHIVLWEIAAKEKPVQWTVILEDDALQTSDQWREQLAELRSDEPTFVYLAHRGGNSGQTGTVPCDHPVHWTLAYAINGAAARVLSDGANEYRQNLIPVDDYLPWAVGAHQAACDDKGGCNAGLYPETRIETCHMLAKHAFVPRNNNEQSDTELSALVPVPKLDGDLVVLTVASDRTHYGFVWLKRSAEYYGYDLRVLGEPGTWDGGNMAQTTGGARKLLLLREALMDLKHKYVLFTDGYDTVFQRSPRDLLDLYRSHHPNEPILFGAERACWPSKAVCERYLTLKPCDSSFRYLNSGTYVGQREKITRILTRFSGAPDSDDQLFYSKQYVRELQKGTNSIELDRDCQFFLPLAETEHGDGWEFKGNRVVTPDGKVPFLLHGNGPAKQTIIGIYNYVAGAWSSHYGGLVHEKAKISAERILLGLVVTGTPFVDEFLRSALTLAHPKSKTLLCVFYSDGANEPLVRIDHEERQKYALYFEIRGGDEAKGRREILRLAEKERTEYALVLTSETLLLEPETVTHLASWNKSVIAGSAQRTGDAIWSNYWTDTDQTGWYRRGFDTLALYNRERTGLWQVPFASQLVLFRNDSYTVAVEQMGDSERTLCRNLAAHGVPVFLDNERLYGTMLGDDKSAAPSLVAYPTLFEAEHNFDLWAPLYLVPNWETFEFEEVCDGVFAAKLFTQRFCDELVRTAEDANLWSGGESVDQRGGFDESYPTRDVFMSQLQLESQWAFLLKRIVKAAVPRLYPGGSIDGEIRLAFVVRYTMDTQKSLDPHGDHSTVTSSILLNTAYEGGGVRFVKQNCTYRPSEPGTLLLHPGSVLTHRHEGLPITAGRRYVFVSFNK